MCYVLCISSIYSLTYIETIETIPFCINTNFETFISQLLLSSNELVCSFKVVSKEFFIFKYLH